jgi:NADH:ubiquinone oxidoreductase subunit K
MVYDCGDRGLLRLVWVAIMLSIYRSRDTVDMEQFNLLRW